MLLLSLKYYCHTLPTLASYDIAVSVFVVGQSEDVDVQHGAINLLVTKKDGLNTHVYNTSIIHPLQIYIYIIYIYISYIILIIVLYNHHTEEKVGEISRKNIYNLDVVLRPYGFLTPAQKRKSSDPVMSPKRPGYGTPLRRWEANLPSAPAGEFYIVITHDIQYST